MIYIDTRIFNSSFTVLSLLLEKYIKIIAISFSMDRNKLLQIY